MAQGLYGTAAGWPHLGWQRGLRRGVQRNLRRASATSLRLDTAYDATAVIGLALAKAHEDGVEITSANMRDRLRAVANPGGLSVGVNDFVCGMQLTKDGNEIYYTGAAGEVDFDEFGGVVTPVEVWGFNDDAIDSVMVRGVREVSTR